jgi:hypothetical protein
MLCTVSLVESQTQPDLQTAISRMHPRVVDERINASTQNAVHSNKKFFWELHPSISLCRVFGELSMQSDGWFVEGWCKIWCGQFHICYLYTAWLRQLSVPVDWKSHEFVGANQMPRSRLRWCTWETMRPGTMKSVRKVSEFELARQREGGIRPRRLRCVVMNFLRRIPKTCSF